MIEAAYLTSLENFVSLDCENFINELSNGFKKVYNMAPNDSEIASWKNSLACLQHDFKSLSSKIPNIRIFIELRMPFSSARSDVFLLGKKGNKYAGIVIELKQWSDNTISIRNDEIYVLGKEELHPYLQAEGYALYLKDFLTVLHESEIRPLAYLHNLTNVNLLKKNNYIVFGKGTENNLVNFITETINSGITDEELEVFLRSSYSPSKTLISQTNKVIQGHDDWILLDEQKFIFKKITSLIKDVANKKKKHVIIVKGGPGTGKSVVALQLLAWALKHKLMSIHITNSKAFTETLRKIVKTRGSHASSKLFAFSSPVIKNILKEGEIFDLILFDEAHRLNANTNSFYMGVKDERHQAYRIIQGSKVSVFFLDENQMVRPNEQGTIEEITNNARNIGAEIHQYKLDVQFRNAGNENFVKWIDYLLGLNKEYVNSSMWIKDFEFKIFNDISEMEKQLLKKYQDGYTCRLIAGFSWPWNDPTHGELPHDVRINGWTKPWNAKPKFDKNAYFKWATRTSEPLSEVGCIYSAQGFEFDYIGVIWGGDLKYANGKWTADVKASHDPAIKKKKADEILSLLKNTYRILLSRGMRGCYVFFTDNTTKKIFEENLNQKS